MTILYVPVLVSLTIQFLYKLKEKCFSYNTHNYNSSHDIKVVDI